MHTKTLTKHSGEFTSGIFGNTITTFRFYRQFWSQINTLHAILCLRTRTHKHRTSTSMSQLLGIKGILDILCLNLCIISGCTKCLLPREMNEGVKLTIHLQVLIIRNIALNNLQVVILR